MSVSFGGLGVILPRPFADFIRILLNKGDIRSVFGLVVFSIVFILLAYLTNPSESSFRAYLTEQSFRQHLTRLDDDPRPFDKPFHFANRASVSLRTPKHVFHSFGVFTVAAMVPLAKQDRPESQVSVISDSWYIGAFGRWWRGGVLEAWYQDVIARSADEESWSSGILGMKSIDRSTDYNALPGLPFSTKNLPPHGLSRGSPPRLRNRDRSSSARSSTPPPLPKTASLPFHTPRNSQDRVSPPLLPAPVTDQQHLTPPLPPSSTLFDQSPRVAELLRQISLSKVSILDLRSQLTDSEACATQSHSALQTELESLRERKRQDDLARTELRTRTKNLDDQKRNAETLKRDAEKRLKTAETARDDTNQRMAFLDREIALLQQRLLEDEASIRRMKDFPEPDQEVVDTLEDKRQEIKAAEDIITALNLRTRELEDKLASEKQRLRFIRDKADRRKQESLQAFGLVYERDDSPTSLSPKPAKLSLGGLSNFNRSSSGLGILMPSSFSPFAESPVSPSAVLSPSCSSLIPAGLISSMENTTDPVSRSFRSENDIIMERDWQIHNGDAHRVQHSPAFAPITTCSPIEHDPFEVRVLSSRERERYQPPPDSLQLASALSRKTNGAVSISATPSKKGLNPDAKVFNYSPKGAISTTSSSSSFDALNPNGIVQSNTSGSNTSFLRAFAPSPAEREALQRLGGSTNASLERLPSLSDVGSIPPSPSHTHAIIPQDVPKGKIIPTWLQSLPKVRKPNFSPWDDENGADI